MLKSVTLENFFAFQERTTIELNPGVNLLLGINGSGKTAFINALRLLSEGIVGDGLNKLINVTWGGFDNIVNANNGENRKDFFKLQFVFSAEMVKRRIQNSRFETDLKYEIVIHSKGMQDYSVEETLESIPKKQAQKPFSYLINKDGKGRISVRDGKPQNRNACIQLENYSGDLKDKELIASQALDRKRYLPIYMFRQIVFQMAIYNYFDTGILKVPPFYSPEKRLTHDGTNLPYLLVQIRRDDEMYKKLEDCLHNVNPNYKELYFEPYASQLYLSLKERNIKHPIGINFLSEGTIQYLLLLSIFYNKNRGKIVALDEPERGLHPDMIKSVGDMLKFAAKESQLIVATHSPLLLNQFELDDIIIFEKNESNAVTIRKTTEDDFPENDGPMLPGQMWLRGQIGGKRW